MLSQVLHYLIYILICASHDLELKFDDIV
jgi:hypothetical protein